ncbi:hypothetical protein DFJ74DRAFT_695938 [Hyaloraphidium curvatum]|nr:hypothetical protein DFJ74DRAFT_695938 [Hyaloraphidium curvatum]
MASQPDLVIRGGLVVDGTGAPAFPADVAISGGKISAVGQGLPRGKEEIDAKGKFVTPGFVDVHTHYDAQAVWDSRLNPSSLHGVTTAVMGNCGVGFAPVRKEQAGKLIELMEGVEDIPESVLADGLDFSWETFAEYLDKIDERPHDIDICALVPHAAVRVYVMGDRAVNLEPAQPRDVEQMRKIIADAVKAGAFGFSTTRNLVHKSSKGDTIPTYRALEDELVGMALGLKDAGAGIIEVNSDFIDSAESADSEFKLIRKMVERSGRPATFLSAQGHDDPSNRWRKLVQLADAAAADGVNIRPVFPPRAVGVLLGLLGSQTPFGGCPSYKEIAHLAPEQRVVAMKDPERRRRILSEDRIKNATHPLIPLLKFNRMFRLTDPPNYHPNAEDSVAAIAERAGKRPEEVAYDMLLENNGRDFLYCPLANFDKYNFDAAEEYLNNRNAIMGLSDGGAHVGMIMDASFQSFSLTHWVKKAGKPIEEIVRRLTSDTALSIGLTDRGVLRPGLKADVNVIDLDALAIKIPEIISDLPSGGRRLMQRADGYEATIVSGKVTYRKGVPTGELPGRVVRCESEGLPGSPRGKKS